MLGSATSFCHSQSESLEAGLILGSIIPEHGLSLLQGLTPEGFQAEMPDIWLQNGNPWEIQRAGIQYRVGFYGSVDQHKWTPGEQVRCGWAA